MLLLEESWKFCQDLIVLSSTGPEASHNFPIRVVISSLCV